MTSDDSASDHLKRRGFLASAGATTVAGLAGCGATSLLDSGGDASGAADGVTLPTIEASGSTKGEVTIPVPGSVTVVDMFATWCGPCKPTLDALTTVRSKVDEDVRFVSATPEPLTGDFTRQDIASWWNEHGGPWTVAHDSRSRLTRAVGTSNVPTSLVFTADGTEVWRHLGQPKVPTVVEKIERARA